MSESQLQVAPTFESAPLQIARWGSQIVLKPHQCAVVRRLVHHNGGLNAFDTGVGKTFSGIATMAIQRERGVCRRPLVVVPNTLVWKWYRDILRCLPDYRVVVVGANRKLNRAGVWVSGPDSQEDRELKVATIPSRSIRLRDCALPVLRDHRLASRSVEAVCGIDAAAGPQASAERARDLPRSSRSEPKSGSAPGKGRNRPKSATKRAIAIVGEDVWEKRTQSSVK